MQSTNRKDIGQKIMLAAGFLAAGLFVLVSMAANLKFGLSLAATPFDRIIYGALSLGADLMKVPLPLVVLILWRNGNPIFAVIAALFCAGLVCYSLAAVVGFAASTRGETITANKVVVDSRKAWEASIERTTQQLEQLGIPRRAAVIQAEIDALLRAPGADGCTVINDPVTGLVCPKVDALRKELAASQQATELQTTLVADRGKLQAVSVTASIADPQSAMLSRLTALSEAQIRDIIAILIALLLEVGSTLGLTLLVLAGRINPAQAATIPIEHAPTEISSAPSPVEPHILVRISETPTDTVTRWAFSRLDVLNAGRIQAEHAYRDFAKWCEGERIRACTLQMFGRRFTEVIAGMGGRKVKVNGRAYYLGVTLQNGAVRKHRLAIAV